MLWRILVLAKCLISVKNLRVYSNFMEKSEADLRKMSHQQLLQHAIGKLRETEKIEENKLPLIETFTPENNYLYGVHGVGNNDL